MSRFSFKQNHPELNGPKLEDLDFGELTDAYKNLICAAVMLDYEYYATKSQFISYSGGHAIYSISVIFTKDLRSDDTLFLYMMVYENGKVVTMSSYKNHDAKLLGAGLEEETIYALMRAL